MLSNDGRGIRPTKTDTSPFRLGEIPNLSLFFLDFSASTARLLDTYSMSGADNRVQELKPNMDNWHCFWTLVQAIYMGIICAAVMILNKYRKPKGGQTKATVFSLTF